MMAAARGRLFRGPDEGWLSLFLVAVMAVAVAWSLDDAALVLGQRDWTDFLAWASLGGVAAGFIGARVGWNRPLAHLIGAAFAALVVPLLVGSVLASHETLAGRYEATAASVVNAFIDFAVRGLQVTRETGHYLLVLGMLCWANGQFAASAVFRHGRPLGPIIVLGAVLVANMSATVHEQIFLIVLFSIASLLLLTRLHAREEQATWLRRRIGDPSVVGSLYLRGGTVFIMIAVFLALALTVSARSAPLAGVWDDAKPALVEVSQWLQRIIPAAPDSRGLGVPAFGEQVTVGGLWSTSHAPALEIQRTAGDGRRLYWRATTYDVFTLRGWTTGVPVKTARPAGTSLLDGTLDAIPASSTRTADAFRITPESGLFHVAFSPIDPLTIDRDATLNLSGTDGNFQSIGIDNRGAYTVTAAIPKVADVAGGLTNNRLRAAGTAYPPGVTARYLSVPDGAIGPFATELLADIQARLKASGQTTPFDLANAIAEQLKSNQFEYQTNVVGVCDHESSIVECFAHYKKGYCEHYASTMAILLRKAGVPARLAEGFLPGDVDVATGNEQVNTDGAHAWVEVYFPGYGWQMFDPTGGGVARTAPLPEGTKVPLASRAPLPSFDSSSGDPRDGPEGPSRRTTSAGAPGSANGSSGPGLVIAAVVLLVAVLLLALLSWRRGPRSASTPEGVYASVAGLARRFGFGPRPTQTAFEYAAALGEVLPGVRPELQTVAAAKVEVSYGRRELGDDRMQALRASYRRLRIGLLRLAFRRPRRKLRR
jgi:transglutaminase-like putative cysteine protease